VYLLSGLGNKGTAYKYTRHNIGYLVIDRFADRFGIPLTHKISHCIVGEGQEMLLAKPQTYMNLSGGPITSLVRKKNIQPENLIVVHDDLDMEFGRLKIRLNGGDGGHKGIRSVIESLGSNQFYRVKVGIGRDPILPPEEYVLSRFRKDELETLSEALDRAVDAIHVFLADGAAKAMSMYNRS
jgi:peptidyl-tRNA hydrolase, PTH1 family